MRTVVARLLSLLLLGTALGAETVTAVWDASRDGVTVGYRLFWSLTAGAETDGQLDAGAATTVTVSGLTAGRTYWFHVRGYAAPGGPLGPSSTEVSYTVPGDPCAFPLGATSVSIFVTGKLNKTGSGGPGSKASITFQAASPNSPIVFLSVRANGVDVPDSVAEGTNLRAIGSLWFTIPPPILTPYTYGIFARNAAGCLREHATGFTTP
jgi:hypothetical protein